MKIDHKVAIILSGFLWMIVGVILLGKGLALLLGPEDPLFALNAIALLIGFVKGRWVLRKSAERVIKRLSSLPNPCAIHAIYSKSYVFLILGMIALGMVFKFVSIPGEIKGFLDVAIGFALISGASFYFRHLKVKA